MKAYCVCHLWIFYVIFPEWCREGGCGHHGQRASPRREICIWDFPTHTAVNKVCVQSLLWIITAKKVHLAQCSLSACAFWCSSSDTLLSHVEQLLRAFILKISVCDAVLNNNPPGSFSINAIALLFNYALKTHMKNINSELSCVIVIVTYNKKYRTIFPSICRCTRNLPCGLKVQIG